jgi:hypothetical protein
MFSPDLCLPTQSPKRESLETLEEAVADEVVPVEAVVEFWLGTYQGREHNRYQVAQWGEKSEL